MTYEQMDKEIREVTDPEAIIENPERMVEAMALSPAIGELAALRVAAHNFHYYREADEFRSSLHRAMAQGMIGPSERLDLVVEETITALVKLTVDMHNCTCERCRQEARRGAAPYN